LWCMEVFSKLRERKRNILSLPTADNRNAI
jgi:hypothetical protein